MGYSKGVKWSDEKIETDLKNIILELKLNTMPTARMIKEYLKNDTLNNAINRSGGHRHWSEKLNIPMGKSETNIGIEFEELTHTKLLNDGYDSELTKLKFPYDILVNGRVKIDVKISLSTKNSYKYFTFNLEHKQPRCDLYICYCLNDDKTISKTYIIPASVMNGKIQLSLGITSSKYDCYIDRWDLIEKLNKCFESMEEK